MSESQPFKLLICYFELLIVRLVVTMLSHPDFVYRVSIIDRVELYQFPFTKAESQETIESLAVLEGEMEM